jgi:hypothetical protein
MSNEETENYSSETYLTSARLVLNRIRKNHYLNDGVGKIFSRNDDFTTVETCLDRLEACLVEQGAELTKTKKELAEAHGRKEPAKPTKSKPFMDFRESQVEALWAHVSNTKRLWDQINQPPTALRALLTHRHQFRDDQFFYVVDMIRDRQDQEMGR